MQLSKTMFTALALSAFCTLSAEAVVIDDNYAGGIDELLAPAGLARDILGGDLYEVYSMDVTTSGSLMSVVINTDFIESDPDNTGGYTPGDLFISTDGWNPYAGSAGAPYYEDQASNGESWEYAYRTATNQVLSITPSVIDIVQSPECCRIGQEILVNGGTDTGAAVSYSGPVASTSGVWDYEYTYVFDYSLIGLTPGDSFGLHWSMTCANDVIEVGGLINRFGDVIAIDGDGVPIPEPTSTLLLAIGLLSLLVTGHRRKSLRAWSAQH